MRTLAAFALAGALTGCAVAPPTWTPAQALLFQDVWTGGDPVVTMPGRLERAAHGALLCRPREAGGGCIELFVQGSHLWERVEDRFGDMVLVRGRVVDRGSAEGIDIWFRHYVEVDEIGPWRGPG